MSRFDSPVREYMTAPVSSIKPYTTLAEAQRLVESRSVSALPVVDDAGDVVGVVSVTDLLRSGRVEALSHGHRPLLEFSGRPAGDIMQRSVVTVSPSDTIAEAAARMVDRHIHRVFVTEGMRLVGVLSTRDIMRAVVAEKVTTPLAAVMSTPVFTIDINATVAMATDRLREAHVRGLVVVEHDWPVGVFTQFEALCARNFPNDAPVEHAMSYEMICLETTTPMHRVAGHAVAMGVRRIMGVEERELKGIVTGLDVARVATVDQTGGSLPPGAWP